MVVALITENEVAAVPPKLTAVAPVKFVPEMVTVVPCAEEIGLKEVIVGIAITLEISLDFLQEKQTSMISRLVGIFILNDFISDYYF
jgi:hypothetical protein